MVAQLVPQEYEQQGEQRQRVHGEITADRRLVRCSQRGVHRGNEREAHRRGHRFEQLVEYLPRQYIEGTSARGEVETGEIVVLPEVKPRTKANMVVIQQRNRHEHEREQRGRRPP